MRQIFWDFHKSRLIYGLPAFLAQKSWISRVENIMIIIIKLLLRLLKRINNIRLKIVLGIPDLCVYLISRLWGLKIKYEIVFNEN